MKLSEFLNLVDIDKQISYLLTLTKDQEQQILQGIKKKNKQLYFQLTGKLKSAKSNPKSKKVLHEILLENEIQEIDINLIKDNPYQPRLQFDDKKVSDMMKSIKKHGLLQPISINKSLKNEYELVIGSTRLEAYRRIGHKTIKCRIISTLKTDSDEFKNTMIEKALIENIHRKDLDNLETAIALKRALDEGIYKNQAAIAEALGKQKIYVTKMLSILKLDTLILDDLKKNKSINDLQALYFIQRIDDKRIQIKKYFDLVNKKITRTDIIDYIKNIKNIKNDDKKEIRDTVNIKVSNNKLILQTDLSKLNNKEKKLLEDDLNKVLKKYFLIERE